MVELKGEGILMRDSKDNYYNSNEYVYNEGFLTKYSNNKTGCI